MLRSVGHAVVVNPDGRLLEIARREGWQVMRFEKLGRRLAIAGATALAAAAGGRWQRVAVQEAEQPPLD